jgi:hypothetical protein
MESTVESTVVAWLLPPEVISIAKARVFVFAGAIAVAVVVSRGADAPSGTTIITPLMVGVWPRNPILAMIIKKSPVAPTTAPQPAVKSAGIIMPP